MANGCIGIAATLCFVLLGQARAGLAKPLASSHSASPGVILVAATVEGQAANLMLDTGAERSCLDAGFAARVGLHATGEEAVRQPYGTKEVDSLRVGDLGLDSFHLRDLEILSGDLGATALAAGVPIDGILGSDVLRRFTVRIDFSSGSAQFVTNATTQSGQMIVRLRHVENLYFVPLSLQGTPVSLLLDTGANTSSVSSHAWSNITTHWRPQSMVDGIRSTGGSASSSFALIPTIAIGAATVRDVPVRVQPSTHDGLFGDAGFDGLMGTDILRQFIVTLDLSNDTMYLKSDPRGHLDFDRFSTIGIQFAKDAEGSFTVMAVWSPSPATNAGMKIGDRILSVNQLDVHSMSLDDFSRQIHGRPGTAVHLTVDSGGRRHEASMATSCLLCRTGTDGERRK